MPIFTHILVSTQHCWCKLPTSNQQPATTVARALRTPNHAGAMPITLTPLEQLALYWFTVVVLQRLMAQLAVILQRLMAQLAVVLQRLVAQLAVVLQRLMAQLAVAPEAYYYRPTSSRSPEVYRPIGSRSPEICRPIGNRSPELYITQSTVLNYSYWRYSVQ